MRFLDLIESPWDWANNNSIVSGLVVLTIGGIVGLLAKQCIAKRKVLKPLKKILTDAETELNTFTSKGIIQKFKEGSVPSTGLCEIGRREIARKGDRLPLRIGDWGGPLCLTNESLSRLNLFLDNPNVPKRVKKELKPIEKSLKHFPYSLKEFNNIWPNGASIEFIEKEYESQISEKASNIESEANLLKEGISKLMPSLGRRWILWYVACDLVSHE